MAGTTSGPAAGRRGDTLDGAALFHGVDPSAAGGLDLCIAAVNEVRSRVGVMSLSLYISAEFVGAGSI